MSAIFHSNTDSPNVLSISGGSGNTINLYAASVGSSLIEFLISDGSCPAYGSALKQFNPVLVSLASDHRCRHSTSHSRGVSIGFLADLQLGSF